MKLLAEVYVTTFNIWVDKIKMMKWGHFQPSHGARKCAYPILEMSQIIVDIQVFCQCCPFRKEELSAGIVTVVDSDVSLMVISVLGEMPSVLRFRSLWLRCWCKGGGGLYAPVFPATSTEGWVFFMCPCLEKSIRNIQKTPGGLLYGQRWSNMWSGLKTPEFRALLCMLPVTYPL